MGAGGEVMLTRFHLRLSIYPEKKKKRFEAIQKISQVLGRKNQPLKLKTVKLGKAGTGIVYINQLKSLRWALETHDR